MSFHGREAVTIENESVRVTVLREGGHVAEILEKKQGVSPLWVPNWRSAEPSTYHPELHPEYGLNSESKLLLGIMGHNLCLDMFGPPSEEEAAAGLTVHGEASVVRYEFEQEATQLKMMATLPLAGLSFQRTLALDGSSILFDETVFNLSALDRPIAWTQHVTLGPPFLNAKTEFAFPASKSRTYEIDADESNVVPAAEFTWPNVPLKDGSSLDLSVFASEQPFSRYTTHLMRSGGPVGFAAYSPEHKTVFGYQWQRDDFPWLGLWQENTQRTQPPWNSTAVTCGFEFGVSPYPETRRQMLTRAPLFETPVFGWIPAFGNRHVSYRAFVRPAERLEAQAWR